MSTLLNRPTAITLDLAARAIDIHKTYGEGVTEVQALRGVSLEVPRGTFLAIMGPSGSGKSTLMHCMAGLDQVGSGTILIGDAEVTSMSERQRTLLRRDRVGFIFQSFNLLGSLTALENVELPLMLAGTKPDPVWLDRLIATLKIGDRLEHTPSELSGGQQQRVAIARALVSRPAIVFADEPTGNLDSKTSGELLAFLQDAVRELRQTIVMVTHDPVAASHADSVVFLADGQLVSRLDEPTVARVLDHLKALES